MTIPTFDNCLYSSCIKVHICYLYLHSKMLFTCLLMMTTTWLQIMRLILAICISCIQYQSHKWLNRSSCKKIRMTESSPYSESTSLRHFFKFRLVYFLVLILTLKWFLSCNWLLISKVINILIFIIDLTIILISTFFWYLVVLQIKHDHQKKKNLSLKRGDNLKIQKVSNSEKIQKVGVNEIWFFFTSSVKKLAKFQIFIPGHFLSLFVLSKLLFSCLTC
jgi:hypothetical protein